jgi:hypothetical protein
VLAELAANKETAYDTGGIINDNFNMVTEEIRNGLLIKLANNKLTSTNIARAVDNHFDKLPENVTNESSLGLNYNEIPHDVEKNTSSYERRIST